MDEQLFIFLIAIGAATVLAGLINLHRTLSRRKWPETIGKIQKNEERQVQIKPNFLFNSGLFSKYTARPIEQRKTAVNLRLSYVYAVGGYKYIGDKLYSAPLLHFTPNRIFGLHEGDKVKVFYSPRNPHKAFLAHSFSWPSLAIIFVGIALEIGTIYFGYMA